MSAVTRATNSSNSNPPAAAVKPKNGNHISDEELRNTIDRFNTLIRVASTNLPKTNLANQLAEERANFLGLVRERAVAQKNWSRALFINKILLDITENHFMRFITSGQIERLYYLLKSDSLCVSPKVLAAASKSLAISRIIISHLKESTHLIRAAERGLNDSVNLSLQHEADPNMKNDVGRTALHCAAAKGYPAVIRTLLENKADPNIVDADGSTPLICALESGCKESQKLLFPFCAPSLFNNPRIKFQLQEGAESGACLTPVPTLDITQDMTQPLLQGQQGE